MKRFFVNNSLSLAMFGLFVVSFAGLSASGFNEFNSEQLDHHMPIISYASYLSSSHFMEAIFENWESEFLQMWAFVLLTIFLRQKGSAESKKLHGKEPEDENSNHVLLHKYFSGHKTTIGVLGYVYGNSLGLALLMLFIVSFVLHGISGMQVFNDEAIVHGSETLSLMQYFASSTFWFESFQNWQSEFLSIGVLVVLSIYLRQQGSPESKPIDAKNSETGR